ncbi:uncharacterized protein LOC123008719 [Tribolium madens]|uniref:uncharacterized protein LOC123008719 n=1 Tax=Tribolium madens TaxID=41895 RepID=UPI001CF75697|nr:uncharacterized protein LOC123008719 [Tribolium madens]
MSFLPFFLILLFLSKNGRPADLNVGTTVFTKADRARECWTSENVALLASRMILEDLLPCPSVLIIDSNEFVTDLIEYFRLILEIVRKETHGKTKHITLVALMDLLGGYLHHAVLPISKYAFYAGLIDYDSIAKLLGLFDEFKLFLRTNGHGWTKPLAQNFDNFEIRLLPLQSPTPEKADCDNLIFVQGDQPQNNEKSEHCAATIPLPFFDSNTRPSSIALPTKSCPLHNIEANTSSYLVMNFFVTSYKCLQLKKSENINKFQCDFVHWIDEQIVPRLTDETFYAAFGGILRVRNTLKKLGVSQGKAEQQINDFQHVIEDAQKGQWAKFHMTRTSMVVFVVLVMLVIWVMFGTMCAYYRLKNTEKPCSPERGPSTTTCTSLVSSKYSYPEKTKSSESSQGCLCKTNDDEDYTTNDSSHTDGRLPSITEMSEQTTSGKKTPSKRSTPKTSPKSKPATPRSKNDGKKQRYIESDSEPETSSDEG